MRLRFKTVGAPLITVLVFLVLASCTRKAERMDVAAKVGEDEIRLEAVTEGFRGREHLFATAEEELAEKQKLLDRLVEQKLLIHEAYRQKLDQDSLLRAFEAAERPLFLLDLLYFREVRDKIKLSDGELRGLYHALKNERCLRQIAMTRKRDADEISARLKRGEDFEKLAQEHSRDRASALKGGDIGCYGWGRPPALNTEQFLKLKKGDLLGPLESASGWAIFKCYDLRPTPLPDFELIQAELRNRVETEREAVRSAEFVEEIRNQINFRVVDSAARLVNRKQVELSKIEAKDQPVRFSNQIRINELAPAERDMPLITYRKKSISVGQYLQSIQGTVPSFRLVLDTTEKTRALLFQLIFKDALIEVAQGRGLDKEPEYLRMVREGLEKQMAVIQQNQILSGVRPDSLAPKKYFDSRPDEFVRQPAVHLYEVNRPLEKELLALRPQILNKDEFLAAASQLSSREQLRAVYGDLGWVEQFQEPELFAAAQNTKVGEIGGPVKLADGSFSLFYLDGRRGTYRQKFSEVEDSLFYLLWARARDSVLTAWMAEQKQKTPITLYPEVLKKTIDYKRYARLKKEDAQKAGGRS